MLFFRGQINSIHPNKMISVSLPAGRFSACSLYEIAHWPFFACLRTRASHHQPLTQTLSRVYCLARCRIHKQIRPDSGADICSCSPPPVEILVCSPSFRKLAFLRPPLDPSSGLEQLRNSFPHVKFILTIT